MEPVCEEIRVLSPPVEDFDFEISVENLDCPSLDEYHEYMFVADSNGPEFVVTGNFDSARKKPKCEVRRKTKRTILRM